MRGVRYRCGGSDGGAKKTRNESDGLEHYAESIRCVLDEI